jgi:formate dehydrogenase maturation protein FdhE
LADGLASLGLDMLVGEAGYQRHVPNQLVIITDH